MYISIHAPRKGSDIQTGVLSDGSRDFNPRPPQGERLCAVFIVTRKS